MRLRESKCGWQAEASSREHRKASLGLRKRAGEGTRRRKPLLPAGAEKPRGNPARQRWGRAGGKEPMRACVPLHKPAEHAGEAQGGGGGSRGDEAGKKTVPVRSPGTTTGLSIKD